MVFSMRELGGFGGLRALEDILDAAMMAANMRREVNQGCPTCKECATKDGRSFRLQMELKSQKGWMEALQKQVKTLEQQNGAYELALKDPDSASIKEKLQKAHVKTHGEYAGFMDYIPMVTEAMLKVEEIAALITEIDKKDTVTSVDVRAVEVNILALKTNVEQTKQKVKDQLQKFSKEGDVFYAQRKKDPTSVDPNYERTKRIEILAFKKTASDAESRLEKTVRIFECCYTGLKISSQRAEAAAAAANATSSAEANVRAAKPAGETFSNEFRVDGRQYPLDLDGESSSSSSDEEAVQEAARRQNSK